MPSIKDPFGNSDPLNFSNQTSYRNNDKLDPTDHSVVATRLVIILDKRRLRKSVGQKIKTMLSNIDYKYEQKYCQLIFNILEGDLDVVFDLHDDVLPGYAMNPLLEQYLQTPNPGTITQLRVIHYVLAKLIPSSNIGLAYNATNTFQPTKPENLNTLIDQIKQKLQNEYLKQ